MKESGFWPKSGNEVGSYQATESHSCSFWSWRLVHFWSVFPNLLRHEHARIAACTLRALQLGTPRTGLWVSQPTQTDASGWRWAVCAFRGEEDLENTALCFCDHCNVETLRRTQTSHCLCAVWPRLGRAAQDWSIRADTEVWAPLRLVC